MTGEELNRKYHELCGWTIKKASSGKGIKWFFLVRPDKSLCGNSMPDHLAWAAIPKLHLDANLAIAEAKKAFNWFHLSFDVDGVVFRRERLNANGKTLNEAILKALIAAKESK